MSTQTAARPRSGARPQTKSIVGIVAAVVLVGAMVYDTKVVKIGVGDPGVPGAFSPVQFGQTEFPKVQAAIVDRAVDAATLAQGLAKDPAATAKQYGVTGPAGDATIYAVKFTGTAGKSDLGVYDVQVPGLPEGTKVQVQTGPAINGTDLRDATGTIKFGHFTNQIEYQNAGSALNKEMKKQVLAKLDAANLAGKTLVVVGAFRPGADPKTWFVTPATLSVQ